MTEPTNAPAEPAGQAQSRQARALLRRAALHPSRPHLVIGVLFAILGLLVTVAVTRTGVDDRWRTARTEDLVQILDDLTGRQERLDTEFTRLAGVERELRAGSTDEAAAEAQRRLAVLEVLTGTTPVIGPGISVLITDPDGRVDAATVLDAVQELRDAGAEAIQVGPARVVVDTWFGDSPQGVVADGQPVGAPIRIVAIGDPDTMATALSIPGGVADAVRTRGGDFSVSAAPEVSISVTVPEAGG